MSKILAIQGRKRFSTKLLLQVTLTFKYLNLCIRKNQYKAIFRVLKESQVYLCFYITIIVLLLILLQVKF